MTINVRAAVSFAVCVLVGGVIVAQQPTPTPTPEPAESFYATSLHATNRGIEYLYAKEQGGLELLTGMSADEMGCLKAKCHVRNCDTCHRVEADGKAAFTADKARIQQACDRCHPVDRDDPDVHVRRGMRCVDCHSAREVHGDGTIWNSARQPGVIDTRCERCHASLSRSASHTAHGGKLSCQSCHTREFVTCLNCHIETRLAQGKESAIQVKGIVFLVNHNGRVTTGNLLSYVYKGRTMITIAPAFSHSIRREGLRCADCHGGANVQAVAAGSFVPFRWENGAMAVTEGVVPVLDGMPWPMPFLEREGDAWVPIADPPKPLFTYAGCAPLSREQLARLEAPRGGR
jgi:hypothetical protein